jgi:hypothetical protein
MNTINNNNFALGFQKDPSIVIERPNYYETHFLILFGNHKVVTLQKNNASA